ncbi:hypothetical protein Pfo_026956 [Paulownia fortunei]|nr:hypothetical protein Pfo_026956 [Paulownia fortunei]
MKVNVVCRKLIKPSTPTPQNLSKYKISFIDELSPPMNMGVILFYPSTPKALHLEESLAKILPHFYPLAGRYIKKDHLVDCSDQGAQFVEAEAVDVQLLDLVEEMKTEQLNDLLPHQFYQVDEAATDPLLSIQITKFKCGGLVISVSVSHRIFDASSVGTLIAAWTNANNPGPGGKITICPSFDSPSLFPRKNQGYGPDFEPFRNRNPSIVVKRFSFSKEAITSLRSKLRPNEGKGVLSSRVISKVRVVCALISKALIGVDQAKYGKSRSCLVVQAVNMRERTIPPLPKHSCGNLAIPSITRCMAATETKDIGIQELVYLLGDGIEKTIADCAEILSPGRDGHKIINDPLASLIEKSDSGEVNAVWFSDWSKFGFYQADFGWGKPVWASIGTLPGENMTVLMDNKEGDGIEAWVHLNHNDMSYFEQDEELRLFTT